MELLIAIGIIGILIVPAILHVITLKIAKNGYLKYRAKCKNYKLTSTVRDIIYHLSVDNGYGIMIEQINGILTDCFVSNINTMYLSEPDSRSPVPLSLALHEFGHIQTDNTHIQLSAWSEVGRRSKLTRLLVFSFIICFVFQHCIKDSFWHLLFFALMVASISIFIILKIFVLIDEICATRIANKLIVNYVDNDSITKICNKTLRLAFVTYVADIFSDFGLSVLFFLGSI